MSVFKCGDREKDFEDEEREKKVEEIGMNRK